MNAIFGKSGAITLIGVAEELVPASGIRRIVNQTRHVEIRHEVGFAPRRSTTRCAEFFPAVVQVNGYTGLVFLFTEFCNQWFFPAIAIARASISHVGAIGLIPHPVEGGL